MNNVISYINPLSNQHHALDDFNKLDIPNKIAICLMTALAAIITLPFLGLGGLCTFRLLVNYAIKKVDATHTSTINKTQDVSSQLIGKKKSTIPDLLLDGKTAIPNLNEQEISKNLADKLSNSEKLLVNNEVKRSFSAFTQELEETIFKFYEAHEKTFDSSSIHGRMHVARAIIFCEVMARYLQSKGQRIDFPYLRRTIALHDAGREGNGVDRWEKESANLLYNHLKSTGMVEEEARQKSSIIIKNRCDPTAVEFIIFQSADCLDIMRPCTGNGGREGFKEKYLSFLKEAVPDSDDFKFRQALIEEAWAFIKVTEEKKLKEFKESKGFMEKLLKIIENESDQFKILSSIL
jgi:hypothetical protein